MRASALGIALALAGAAHAQAPRPVAALDLFVSPMKGHCIACHQLPEGSGPATRADLGPKLAGARMRELGKPALRRLLDDPLPQQPETLMPPFGKHRILEPAEIDRLVEFLHALP